MHFSVYTNLKLLNFTNEKKIIETSLPKKYN